MLAKLKRWNNSYWCPTCKKNVFDTETKVTDTLDYHVCNEDEYCPTCGHVFNEWAYGYWMLPGTKIARIKYRIAMERSSLVYRAKNFIESALRKWKPCTVCSKRWTVKRLSCGDNAICGHCAKTHQPAGSHVFFEYL